MFTKTPLWGWLLLLLVAIQATSGSDGSTEGQNEGKTSFVLTLPEALLNFLQFIAQLIGYENGKSSSESISRDTSREPALFLPDLAENEIRFSDSDEKLDNLVRKRRAAAKQTTTQSYDDMSSAEMSEASVTKEKSSGKEFTTIKSSDEDYVTEDPIPSVTQASSEEGETQYDLKDWMEIIHNTIRSRYKNYMFTNVSIIPLKKIIKDYNITGINLSMEVPSNRVEKFKSMRTTIRKRWAVRNFQRFNIKQFENKLKEDSHVKDLLKGWSAEDLEILWIWSYQTAIFDFAKFENFYRKAVKNWKFGWEDDIYKLIRVRYPKLDYSNVTVLQKNVTSYYDDDELSDNDENDKSEAKARRNKRIEEFAILRTVLRSRWNLKEQSTYNSEYFWRKLGEDKEIKDLIRKWSKHEMEMLWMWSFQPVTSEFERFETFYRRIVLVRKESWRKSVYEMFKSWYKNEKKSDWAIVDASQSQLEGQEKGTHKEYLEESDLIRSIRFVRARNILRRKWGVGEKENEKNGKDYYDGKFKEEKNGTLKGWSRHDLELLRAWIHQHETEDFLKFEKFFKRFVENIKEGWQKKIYEILKTWYGKQKRSDSTVHIDNSTDEGTHPQDTEVSEERVETFQDLKQKLRKSWSIKDGSTDYSNEQFRKKLSEDKKAKELVKDLSDEDLEMLWIWLIQTANEDFSQFENYYRRTVKITKNNWQQTIYDLLKSKMSKLNKQNLAVLDISSKDFDKHYKTIKPTSGSIKKVDIDMYSKIRKIFRTSWNTTEDDFKKNFIEKFGTDKYSKGLLRSLSQKDIEKLWIWVSQNEIDDYPTFEAFISSILVTQKSKWKLHLYRFLRQMYNNTKVTTRILEPQTFSADVGNYEEYQGDVTPEERRQEYTILRKALRRKWKLKDEPLSYSFEEFKQKLTQNKEAKKIVDKAPKDDVELLWLFTSQVDIEDFKKFERFYWQIARATRPDWRKNVFEKIKKKYEKDSHVQIDNYDESEWEKADKSYCLHCANSRPKEEVTREEHLSLLRQLIRQRWNLTEGPQMDFEEFERRLVDDEEVQSYMVKVLGENLRTFWLFTTQTDITEYNLLTKFLKEVIKEKPKWRKSIYELIKERYKKYPDSKVEVVKPDKANSGEYATTELPEGNEKKQNERDYRQLRLITRLRWKIPNMKDFNPGDFEKKLENDPVVKELIEKLESNDLDQIWIWIYQNVTDDYFKFKMLYYTIVKEKPEEWTTDSLPTTTTARSTDTSSDGSNMESTTMSDGSTMPEESVGGSSTETPSGRGFEPDATTQRTKLDASTLPGKDSSMAASGMDSSTLMTPVMDGSTEKTKDSTPQPGSESSTNLASTPSDSGNSGKMGMESTTPSNGKTGTTKAPKDGTAPGRTSNSGLKSTTKSDGSVTTEASTSAGSTRSGRSVGKPDGTTSSTKSDTSNLPETTPSSKDSSGAPNEVDRSTLKSEIDGSTEKPKNATPQPGSESSTLPASAPSVSGNTEQVGIESTMPSAANTGITETPNPNDSKLPGKTAGSKESTGPTTPKTSASGVSTTKPSGGVTKRPGVTKAGKESDTSSLPESTPSSDSSDATRGIENTSPTPEPGPESSAQPVPTPSVSGKTEKGGVESTTSSTKNTGPTDASNDETQPGSTESSNFGSTTTSDDSITPDDARSTTKPSGRVTKKSDVATSKTDSDTSNFPDTTPSTDSKMSTSGIEGSTLRPANGQTNKPKHASSQPDSESSTSPVTTPSGSGSTGKNGIKSSTPSGGNIGSTESSNDATPLESSDSPNLESSTISNGDSTTAANSGASSTSTKPGRAIKRPDAITSSTKSDTSNLPKTTPSADSSNIPSGMDSSTLTPAIDGSSDKPKDATSQPGSGSSTPSASTSNMDENTDPVDIESTTISSDNTEETEAPLKDTPLPGSTQSSNVESTTKSNSPSITEPSIRDRTTTKQSGRGVEQPGDTTPNDVLDDTSTSVDISPSNDSSTSDPAIDDSTDTPKDATSQPGSRSSTPSASTSNIDENENTDPVDIEPTTISADDTGETEATDDSMSPGGTENPNMMSTTTSDESITPETSAPGSRSTTTSAEDSGTNKSPKGTTSPGRTKSPNMLSTPTADDSITPETSTKGSLSKTTSADDSPTNKTPKGTTSPGRTKSPNKESAATADDSNTPETSTTGSLSKTTSGDDSRTNKTPKGTTSPGRTKSPNKESTATADDSNTPETSTTGSLSTKTSADNSGTNKTPKDTTSPGNTKSSNVESTTKSNAPSTKPSNPGARSTNPSSGRGIKEPEATTPSQAQERMPSTTPNGLGQNMTDLNKNSSKLCNNTYISNDDWEKLLNEDHDKLTIISTKNSGDNSAPRLSKNGSITNGQLVNIMYISDGKTIDGGKGVILGGNCNCTTKSPDGTKVVYIAREKDLADSKDSTSQPGNNNDRNRNQNGGTEVDNGQDGGNGKDKQRIIILNYANFESSHMQESIFAHTKSEDSHSWSRSDGVVFSKSKDGSSAAVAFTKTGDNTEATSINAPSDSEHKNMDASSYSADIKDVEHSLNSHVHNEVSKQMSQLSSMFGGGNAQQPNFNFPQHNFNSNQMQFPSFSFPSNFPSSFGSNGKQQGSSGHAWSSSSGKSSSSSSTTYHSSKQSSSSKGSSGSAYYSDNGRKRRDIQSNYHFKTMMEHSQKRGGQNEIKDETWKSEEGSIRNFRMKYNPFQANHEVIEDSAHSKAASRDGDPISDTRRFSSVLEILKPSYQSKFSLSEIIEEEN